jgi:prepilin-type N-terminal cleavage/methylation domain-containing protein
MAHSTLPARRLHTPAVLSAFTLVEIMVVVVIIGVLASLSIPQFMKIRIKSQDAAVLNNVRQLASASSQYFLERGATVVAHDDLVGSTNYVKNLQNVASETYPTFYTQGQAITVTGIGGMRTITYEP